MAVRRRRQPEFGRREKAGWLSVVALCTCATLRPRNQTGPGSLYVCTPPFGIVLGWNKNTLGFTPTLLMVSADVKLCGCETKMVQNL